MIIEGWFLLFLMETVYCDLLSKPSCQDSSDEGSSEPSHRNSSDEGSQHVFYAEQLTLFITNYPLLSRVLSENSMYRTNSMYWDR